MKVLIVTDAWPPQTNGVVRTLQAIGHELEKAGWTVRIEGPALGRWCALPLPFYRDIVFEFLAAPRLAALVETFAPDAIHIATEGPLGWAARRVCLQKGLAFSTAYHTRFPEYLSAGLPPFLRRFVLRAAYAVLRRFHAPAAATLVATSGLARELAARGFAHLDVCPPGVDTGLFSLHDKTFAAYRDLPRPILLYVGRVSAEKNIEAFLALRTTGSKIVVGDGPDRAHLKRAFPEAHFLGWMARENLAQAFAGADLFVFPSRTDTFGLVLLEAAASGLRIAAYNVRGPRDALDSKAEAFAVLSTDLQQAVDKALTLPDTRLAPRAYAEGRSWSVSAARFDEILRRTAKKEKSEEKRPAEGVDAAPRTR